MKKLVLIFALASFLCVGCEEDEILPPPDPIVGNTLPPPDPFLKELPPPDPIVSKLPPPDPITSKFESSDSKN